MKTYEDVDYREALDLAYKLRNVMDNLWRDAERGRDRYDRSAGVVNEQVREWHCNRARLAYQGWDASQLVVELLGSLRNSQKLS